MMTKLTDVTREFRAMNTDVNVAVCTPAEDIAEAASALDNVRMLFSDTEIRLSRFMEESELSALNRSAGRPFAASRELYDIVAAALDFSSRTGGRFDPAILPVLVATGYDRSFEYLTLHQAAAAELGQRCTWREVRLDRENRTITLPRGGALDLGGIGKGWTADRAAAGLRHFDGFVIDAGGDIVVGGTQANGSPWTVGIADPFDDSRDLAVLSLTGGAVCTSSTLKRRWDSDGREAHHIIDPRSGQPARSGVVSATVRADTAAAADVLAKTAVIMGERHAFAFINGWTGAAVFLVLEDGATRYTDGFTFA